MTEDPQSPQAELAWFLQPRSIHSFVFLIRRPSPMNWIWGCLSMPIWPRLATYSYLLTLPFIFYCIRR